ncbi:MAG: response regulator [Actinomycetota bacterium]|nr:response regulator [Actinomycetota bacterium]
MTDGDARAEAAARLAAIVESSHDAIVAKALDGTILTWNAGAERLYGYSADEAVGRHISLVVPPENHDEVEAILQRIRNGELVDHYETVRVAKDGRRLHVSLTASPVKDAAGVIVGASVIARDVSESKQAESLLRRQAAALKEQADLLDLTHDGVIVRDLEGTIAFWNSGAEATYGWRKDEAVGQLSHDLLQTEFPLPLADLTAAVVETGRWEGELVHHTRDGRCVVVSSRWSLRLAEDGRPDAVLEINNDITARKEAEEAMAAAKAAAEAASLAKSEFLANMSHEIRTPMNGVLGMCGLLLDTDLDEEQREYAEAVRTSAEALLAVINDILDFSKVEAGKIELEILDFDVRSTVEEAAELLAEQATGKGLELSILVEPEVPRAVRGDPGRLRQVLLNLMSNAVKFTAQGEVVVRVRVVDEGDDEVTLRFSVCDTGIGIAAEVQAGLFRSFAQADASTTRRYGGTGLGLAISKQLVELMGGEIGVDSAVGRGSTFWFTARFPRAADAEFRVPANGSLVGLRVLVVDDNATNRTILEHNLRSFRTRPDTVEGGSRALEMLRTAARSGDPYAIAVLDFHMPEMDGIELARAIRDDPLLAGLRLVLLTSKGERGDARVAREAGIHAFLTKPVRVSALCETLAATMGSGASPTTRQPSAPPPPTRTDAPRWRILVVEDNVVNQKVATRMLESLGHRADVAANGIEAVQALSELPYDAVLMDCQMPEMDGYQATAEIRRIEGPQRHTPIIAMTAGAMMGDEERARSAGMDDYVSKPVTRDELAAALNRWLVEDQRRESP